MKAAPEAEAERRPRPESQAFPGWWSGTCNCGQLLSSVAAICATASSRCSQLSRMSNSCRGRRKSIGLERSGRSPLSVRSKVAAMVLVASGGSLIGANSVSQTPWTYPGANSSPTRNARRLLPQPAAPERVSKRTPSCRRKPHSSANSCHRPMKELRATGKRQAGFVHPSPLPPGSGRRWRLLCRPRPGSPGARSSPVRWQCLGLGQKGRASWPDRGNADSSPAG